MSYTSKTIRFNKEDWQKIENHLQKTKMNFSTFARLRIVDNKKVKIYEYDNSLLKYLSLIADKLMYGIVIGIAITMLISYIFFYEKSKYFSNIIEKRLIKIDKDFYLKISKNRVISIQNKKGYFVQMTNKNKYILE
jgi:hypothetical protein